MQRWSREELDREHNADDGYDFLPWNIPHKVFPPLRASCLPSKTLLACY
jgi:hypothetical protein